MDSRAFLEHLPDALLVVETSGAILYANGRADSMFGYEPGALVGRPIEDLMPVGGRGRHAVLREGFHASPQRRPMAQQRNLRGLRLDGTEFPVEISLSPVVHEGRECVLTIVRDVTLHRTIEQAARLARVAVEAAANGIAITDPQGSFVWVNPAFTELTGYTLDEVVGRSPRILKSGHHDETFYRTLWTRVLAGEVWRGETVNRRKDGSIYVEEQTIAPVRDEDGKVTHFVAIKQDVTARRQAEDAARRRIRELELFDTLARLGTEATSAAELLEQAAPLVREALGLVSVRIAPRLRTSGAQGELATVITARTMDIPLRVGDRTIALLEAVFPTDYEHREERERVLVTVAGQLATAAERARLFAELERQAQTDGLTGVYNRRGLFDRLDREVDRAKRYGRPLSVLLLDVDHFKKINDTHGHAVGDEVLRELGHRISAGLRRSDFVGRYGGEEFVMVLPETERNGAAELGERVRSAIAKTPFATEVGELRVTISAGVASISDASPDVDVMLKRADDALYAAKRSGRDRIYVAETERSPRPLFEPVRFRTRGDDEPS
ncbi:MAG: diguanylate cyclase [Polyangiales bacterium]